MENHQRFPFRFFVITFLWSWLVWLPLVLAGSGKMPLIQRFVDNARLPLTVLGAFGPAAGACFSLRTLAGRGAVRQYLRSLLDFRFGWQAWILPVLALGGGTCVAWALPELWGASRLGVLLPSLWVFPLYLLLMMSFGGGQEELGWRGFILDPIEARLGPLLGNLLFGVVWAVWHLPLFFIPGTSQAFMSFPAFMLLTTGYSWFFSWVRHASGKRTMAGLYVHGLANAFVPVFPTLVMKADAPQPRFWIFAGVMFVVGLATTTLRLRHGQVQHSAHPSMSGG